MFNKIIYFILFIQNIYLLTNGQVADKFFRQDYTYIEDTHSFYKVQTQHKTWAEAKLVCESEGAALFYPEDEDEVLFVIAHWNKTQPTFPRVFIGIADWNVREVFETTDGRAISDVYNKWAYGEPNNADGKEGCVILNRDSFLNDVKCNNRYPFICKKQLATVQWNKECNLPDSQYKYNERLSKCYKFHLTPRNWSDAHTVCSAEQSYLAVINSEEERAYLVNITAMAPKDNIVGEYLRGGIHLGFQNLNGWITVKGVPLHQSGYSRWGYSQPDGVGAENCGSMFFTGELNDIGCFQKMFFICEHDVKLQAEVINYRFGEESKNKVDNFVSIFGTPPPHHTTQYQTTQYQPQ